MSQIIDPGKLMKAAPTVQPVLPVLTPDMLRDWFACAALQGYVAGTSNEVWEAKKSDTPDICAEIAKDCYLFADAMIAARVKE